ncbi:MAG: hypothetical protein IKS87_09220 [Lachnospiraceae bacterium]|nr:hypothetical protein [Lachnospiraceae bacterium]
MQRRLYTVTGILFIVLLFTGCSLLRGGGSLKDTVSKDVKEKVKEEKDPETKKTEKKKKKDRTVKAREVYDGVWYEQGGNEGVLFIENGEMEYECDRFTDVSAFTCEESEAGFSLKPSEELFFFYEVSYETEADRILTRTWPMDDGDGGYHPGTFLRTEYVPGEEVTLQYLEGEWELLDGGSMIQDPESKPDVLAIGSAAYHSAAFTKGDDLIERFNYELTDLFPQGPGKYDKLTIFKGEKSLTNQWGDTGSDGVSFQVFLANNLGWDYLMLRELGDERTAFASDGLGYDRSIGGTWVFRRKEDIDPNGLPVMKTPSTWQQEEDIRNRDATFYAIRWLEFGNSATLQEVELQETTIRIFDETLADVCAFSLPDTDTAYSAVNYEYKGGMMNAHEGFFEPGLVEVKTNSNGEITSLRELEYAVEGYYYRP